MLTILYHIIIKKRKKEKRNIYLLTYKSRIKRQNYFKIILYNIIVLN